MNILTTATFFRAIGMLSKVYKKQSTIDMYYTMHYAPFLKKGNAPCLTEPFYQQIIHILKPYLNKNTRLLDIGCALGRMVFELAKHDIDKAVGIDTSSEFITACKKIAENQNEYLTYRIPTHANISFQIADAQDLPFVANSFTCILCLNVIDRVPHPKKVVEEMTRVLSPNGLLLISDPYDWGEEHTPLSEFIENMLDVFPQSQWEVILEEDRIPFTMLVYDRKISTYANHTLLLRKR